MICYRYSSCADSESGAFYVLYFELDSALGDGGDADVEVRPHKIIIIPITSPIIVFLYCFGRYQCDDYSF